MRLGLMQVGWQVRPRSKPVREGYIRPDLHDLAVLADLLDDPLFPTFEVVERAVYRQMGLEAPKEIEVPESFRADVRRARRFRREWAGR